MKKAILLLFSLCLGLAAKADVDITSEFSNMDFESCTWNSSGWVATCPGWTIDWSLEYSKLWPDQVSSSDASSVSGYKFLLWNAASNEASAGKIIYQSLGTLPAGTYTLSAVVHSEYSGFYLFANDDTTEITTVSSSSKAGNSGGSSGGTTGGNSNQQGGDSSQGGNSNTGGSTGDSTGGNTGDSTGGSTGGSSDSSSSTSTWATAYTISVSTTLTEAGTLTIGIMRSSALSTSSEVNLYADNFTVTTTATQDEVTAALAGTSSDDTTTDAEYDEYGFGNLDFESGVTVWTLPYEAGLSTDYIQTNDWVCSPCSNYVYMAWNASGNTTTAADLIYQSATLPAGTYSVSCYSFTDADDTFYLFANDNTVALPNNGSGYWSKSCSQSTVTTTLSEEGTLRIGLSMVSTSSEVNIYADNFVVEKVTDDTTDEGDDDEDEGVGDDDDDSGNSHDEGDDEDGGTVTPDEPTQDDTDDTEDEVEDLSALIADYEAALEAAKTAANNESLSTTELSKLNLAITLYGNLDTATATKTQLETYTSALLSAIPTGISATAADAQSLIYNLNGQQLSQPVRGLNIINGVKVIVK